MANKMEYKELSEVIKKVGLKDVWNYVHKQHALPPYTKNSKEAFTDFCAKAPYGGMFLDEKVIEWANQGEISNNKKQSANLSR